MSAARVAADAYASLAEVGEFGGELASGQSNIFNLFVNTPVGEGAIAEERDRVAALQEWRSHETVHPGRSTAPSTTVYKKYQSSQYFVRYWMKNLKILPLVGSVAYGLAPSRENEKRAGHLGMRHGK